jgi:hypothetical protein
MKILPTISILTFLAALPAQQNITGRLIVAPASACDSTATHAVEGTPFLLKSATVNLASLENKVVDIGGVMTGPLTCITLEVASLASAKYQHTVTAANQFKIGTNVTFKGTGPFLSEVGLLISGGPTFLPLGVFGALLVDPANYVMLGPSLALLGSYSVTVQIPNDVSLIGGHIHSQSFWLTLVPSITASLVNSVGFVIGS